MTIKVTIIGKTSNTIKEFNNAEDAAKYFAGLAGIKFVEETNEDDEGEGQETVEETKEEEVLESETDIAVEEPKEEVLETKEDEDVK